MLSKLSMLALASSALAELPPIHMKGTKFFYENGTQFFMKGIAYQRDIAEKGKTNDKNGEYIDPLSNKEICERDVPLLEELGTNTIRTYAIDPTLDHTDCMKMLDDAGIYVISDLSQPKLSINREDPSWNVDLYNRYKAVVDELAQYSNTIGFFAGNEVSDAPNNTAASAYVKAAVRDTKAHIANSDFGRWLGVGYATNDHPDIRDNLADYFNCGTDEEASDFWGYNIYSWCQESSMEKSGYNKQIEFYKDYSIPTFFAEYGCNEPDGAEGRIWDETTALYNDDMTEVFSGGIVYMYFQEENDYGLVEIEDGEAKKMDNFEPLAKKHKAADPQGVHEDDYEFSGEREQCPEVTEDWTPSHILPPTPDQGLCDCMIAASPCGPASDLDEEDYGDIFDYICDEAPEVCAGINGNVSTGVYGAYSMCNPKAKLTYVLGAYYDAQDSNPSACDHDGKAEIKDPSAESSCDEALESASALNEEAATATAPLANTAPTGSDDEGEDDEGAAITSAPIARLFSFGNYAVAMYMVVAMGVGSAMVLL